MRSWTLVLIVSCACYARPARAGGGDGDGEQATVEAKRLAARAQVHYDLGEYTEAISDYREAYRLRPTPGLLFNLGQAYRLMGDCVSATTMYRNYLRLAPRTPYRKLVRQHLSALESCYQRRTGEQQATAEVVLTTASPGKPGRVAGIGDPPDEGDQRRDDGEGHPGRAKRRAGAVLGVSGAAMVGFATYFGLDAMSTADEVSERHGNGERWRDLEELDRHGRHAERLSIGLFAAGGLAVATGTVLYLLGKREARQATAITVTPTRGGGSLAVRWEL
jgi:tetratricopeptide (TPR) repeat protein